MAGEGERWQDRNQGSRARTRTVATKQLEWSPWRGCRMRDEDRWGLRELQAAW
jgi:hypothetical protein